MFSGFLHARVLTGSGLRICESRILERLFLFLKLLWYILGMVKRSEKIQVEHIAELSRLSLGESEAGVLGKQLAEIVDYVGRVQKLGIGNKELGKRKENTDRTRGDKVEAERCLSQEDALSGTENEHNGLFVAPAIFGE